MVPPSRSQLAKRLRDRTATLGEVMAWLSALYFRGKIAYARNSQIFVIPETGGTPQLVATNGTDPRFSPDGSRIVFISDRSGDDNLWTVKADGSDAQALTILAT